MALNSLQKALVVSGWAEEPKPKRKRHKKYACRKCGAPMRFIDETNIMTCTGDKCRNYFLFTN